MFAFFPQPLSRDIKLLVFLLHRMTVEIQTCVQPEKHSVFSFSFAKCGWGLVCGWVPRIKITAVEKHIFAFQEIRAANLLAEDLTSPLWLKLKVTSKSQEVTLPNKSNTDCIILFLKWYQPFWDQTTATASLIDSPPFHGPNCPISYHSGSFLSSKWKMGLFPTARPNRIF